MAKADIVKKSETDSKHFKSLRNEQAKEAKGYPLNNDRPLHPAERVEESNAYKRADGTRHKKGE
jgi:hypothetical protein